MFPFNDAGMWSGLLCGTLFGLVLESAGFGSPCKLTAQFRLTDWSVFKVMFTAIVVAAIGLWALRVAGFVAADALYVPGAYLVAAGVGGALVGVGFAVGGYCPGTSIVGLFSGRLDAFVFLGGLIAGTAGFAALYGEAEEKLLTMGTVERGDTFADALGVPDVVTLGVLVLALVAVFVIGGRMERARRGPVSAAEAVSGADEELTA